MNDPILFQNGNIITLNPDELVAEACAMAGGKIIGVGTNEDISKLFGHRGKVIDLRGKTVLPGFIDAHVHFMATAITSMGTDLSEAKKIDEVLALLEKEVKETPHGEWIFGYFITHLSDRNMPTRWDLDRISTSHPIRLFHRNGHLCSINTKAIELLNLPKHLDGIEMEAGEMTGVIRDPAIQLLPHPESVLKEERIRASFILASQMAAANGVTTLHALEDDQGDMNAIELLQRVKADLPIHIVLYPQTMDVQAVLHRGFPRIGGCICADGAFESHTAALFEPYADEPDHYGTLNFTQTEMSNFILRAHREGLQIAVHCEGDRAIEQVLFAYENALRHVPKKDHRHRIEHFEIPTENQLERVGQAGIIICMQPAFLPLFFFRDGLERYEKFLGRSRLKRIHPYQSMLSQGILMCGGSDSPVTRIDPLGGISAVVNHPHREERLSVLEAIKLFTLHGAKAAFEEDIKGSIEEGKVADLIILSGNLLATNPDQVGTLSVDMTFVKGKLVYSRNEEMEFSLS